MIAGLNITIAGGPLQEFVVGGFTEGKGTRLKSFGALLLGGYRDGKLRYFGHSGSGFSEKGLQDRFRLADAPADFFGARRRGAERRK